METVLFLGLGFLTTGAFAMRFPSLSSYPVIFSEHELDKAEERLHRIANEKDFLKQKLSHLKEEKSLMLDKLSDVIHTTIPDFEHKQDIQNGRLSYIKDKIKSLLHDLGPLESQLDGEVVVARRQEEQINELWARLHALTASNHKQSASLQKSTAFLQHAKEKLDEKLEARKNSSEAKVNELIENTKAAADLTNTRHCLRSYNFVEIDQDTGLGTKDFPFHPSDQFGSNVIPTVFCALQGFVGKLHRDQSKSFNVYGVVSDDELKHEAVAVDCKPFDDHVEIQAFDQSKGKGNEIQIVYVEIKACSFGPQSHSAAGLASPIGASART